MRAIAENSVIQIDIVNGCVLACSNCTRHVGHHRKPFIMSLDYFRQAVESLVDFPGKVGIMGGEPTMHPKFREILAILRELIPRERREFWTTGFKWMKYQDDIEATFEPKLCHVNDHSQETGRHQPLLIAIEEVIPDAALREELIDNCPIQTHWSASITPRGAFFCEVAASLDHLFDGPGGWPVEPGWWKRIPSDYAEQREFSCNKCSAAIPMATLSDGRGGRDWAPDVVSAGNLERLKAVGSPKIARGDYRLWSKTLTRKDIEEQKNWKPRQFRDFVAHSLEEVRENVPA